MKYSVFSISPWSNRFLLGSMLISILLMSAVLYVPLFRSAFRFDSLGLTNILILAAASSSVFILGEIFKALRKLLPVPSAPGGTT